MAISTNREVTRYDNIKLVTDFEYRPDRTNRLDKIVLVPSSVAKTNDKLIIDGDTYVAEESSKASAERWIILVDNKQDVLKTPEKLRNIIVVPAGSTNYSQDLADYKAVNEGSRKNVSTEDKKEETTTLPDGSPVEGAGASTASLKKNAILDFAAFKESLAFRTFFTEAFKSNSQQSLHEYLASSMGKFYHQLYYVPNLRNNYTMIVKPETLFINAPTCNLILPNLKNSISYSRSYKSEPTRLLQRTDPIAEFSGEPSGPLALNTLIFMNEEDTLLYKNGLRLYRSVPTTMQAVTDQTKPIPQPLLQITDYERKFGINTSLVEKGADIYLFLKSKENEIGAKYFSVDSSNQSEVGETLARLATYELLRQRFMARTGSVSMYFNPYIVPGFPMVSIETYSDGMNIYGYVTNVVHNFDSSGWSTTVTFSCAHTDDENTPGAFPIIETEYADAIDDTYKDMLGPSVSSIRNSDIPGLVEGYGSDKQYMTQSYRKIWRETASLDEYLEKVADGAVIVEDNNYTWFQNSEDHAFFDVAIQNRIKEYTDEIVNKHIAHYDDAVR